MAAREPGIIAGYPVIRQIGQGGMGIVHLATDPRLGRPLAIKVLPESLALDRQAIARIRHEARMLAALNHPNIATIYGMEELEDGSVALILEFIEGQTLSARLRAGRMPPGEALRIGEQIAEGLEGAHRKGVIHGDLKPGNLMLCPDGRVKLLDFGLARSRPVEAVQATGLATLTTESLDEAGHEGLTGTAGYMSPEQIQRRPLDQRTDLFSFGCVLYECLRGRPAFPGRTAIEAIVATLTLEPSWDALPAGTPPSVRRLLESCLRKDPDSRVASARVVASQLRAAQAAGPAPAGTSPPSLLIPTTHLPAPLTSFVGRETILAQVGAMIDRTRLVCLTGPGGCGKTRLALELAPQVRHRFPDGVWWIDLSQLREAEQVAPAVALALQVKEIANEPPLETLLGRLRDTETLLILDNCEHLLSASAELATDLLRGCPGLKILATSRQRFGLPGEQDFPVPPLSLPDPRARLPREQLLAHEAVRLFRDRARRVRPDWDLSEQTAPVVVEICRHLDGNPLAIELAAARVRVLTVEQIASKLDDRFRLLSAATSTASGRHATLRGTLDWSYQLLEPAERLLLRRLSCFAGGWSLEAAAAVAGAFDEFEVLDLTDHLADKSLVVVERARSGETRYRLLETVRQYAQEQLREAGEEKQVRDRHLDYFLDLAEKSMGKLRGPEQKLWTDRFSSDHDNLVAAVDWSLVSPRAIEKGLRLVAAVWPHWELQGQLALGRGLIEKTLASDPSAAGETARAGALTGAGSLAWQQGDYAASRALHSASLEIWRRRANSRGVATCLGNLGLVATESGDLDSARAHYEECLDLFRDLGDRLGIAKTLSNLGIVLRRQGKPETARDLQLESLLLRGELGDRRGEAICHHNLSIALLDLDAGEPAREHLRQTLEIVREIGEHLVISGALQTASRLARSRGDLERAARLCAAADALYRDAGFHPTKTKRMELDQLIDSLREVLDASAFSNAWNQGNSMTFEEATAYALEGL